MYLNYHLDRLSFLVIDDNAYMRRIIRSILHGVGVRNVFEAEDGASGFEAMTHYSPDIVILDMMMPIFDGLEFLNLIRSPTNEHAFIPIIVISAHLEADKIMAARNAGANEFLAKPVSSDQLMKRILSVIERPRPFVNTPNYFGPCRRRTHKPFKGDERRLNIDEKFMVPISSKSG
ncbi:MAG: response regulator [Rhizobiales bacterium]|nr:response regulator [Hyphomicrobiales bacterium]NRB15003.1 response regulator [Hyphomicrobiales bacterium]